MGGIRVAFRVDEEDAAPGVDSQVVDHFFCDILLTHKRVEGSKGCCTGLAADYQGIILERNSKHSHASCCNVVGNGEVGINQRPEYIPCDGRRLSTGKASHNCIQFSRNIVRLAISDLCRLINTGGLIGFDYYKLGKPVFEEGGIETDYRSSQGTNTCLNVDMGGSFYPHTCKLFLCFQQHCGITLHDPGGNFCITGPGCVGDNVPAIFSCINCDLAYCIVIVAVNNSYIGAKHLDCIDSGLACVAVNIDVALVSKHAAGPGNAPAVVAIGGRGKGKGSCHIMTFLADEELVGQLFIAHAEFFLHEAVDCKRATHYFETVEHQSLRLIFYIDAFHTKHLGQMREGYQGSLAKARQLTMEVTCTSGHINIEKILCLPGFVTRLGKNP